MFVINTVIVTSGTSVPARGRLVTKQDFVPTHDLQGQSYTFSNLNEGNVNKALAYTAVHLALKGTVLRDRYGQE